MAGRDASPSRGGRAASQSPRPASSRSNTSSANLSASQRAAERERLALKDDLAAWRERREHHRLQQKQPKTPPQPRPFSLITTSGPSDEEKQLILQRRRELMRSPSKQPPPGASLPVQARRNSKEDSASSKIPGGPPLAMRADAAASGAQAKPPPRTPPPRKAGQNGPRPSARPPPPQTPPLAPRPPPSRTLGPRAPHGQRRERLPSEPANAPVATDFETPLVPLMTLSTETQLSSEQQHSQQQRQATLPEPEDAFVPLRELPPSPPVVDQPRPTTFEAGQQWIHPKSDGDAVANVEPSVIETKTPSVPSLLPPVPMTPPRRADSKNERGSSLTPVSGSLQASPGKQVRFAEDKTVGCQDRGGGQVSSDDNSMVHDTAHDLSDDELTDSQSSRGREMMEREQLLSEVDELIHQHTEEVIVTDHLVHRHTAADGHERIDERVSRTHTEKSTFEHVLEEKTPDERLPDEDTSVLAAATDDQADVGVCRDLSSLVGHHVEAKPTEDSASANGNGGEVGVHDGKNAGSGSGVRLRVVKSRLGAGSEESSLPIHPLATEAHQRMSHLRNAMVVASLIVVGAVAFCLLYPQSPMSRTIRETKNMSFVMASYFGTRATVWLWHTIIHPASAKISKTLVLSNSWLTPLAEATRSLVDNGWQELLTLCDRVKGSALKVPEIENLCSELGRMFVRSAKSVFSRISSRIADALLYVSSSLMQPLPSIDPDATMAVHNRLQHLTEVQSQLRVKVKDLLRTQEEWALEELERMKQRRVAHATATQSILTETTKMMLQVVEEAKLSAAEHVQEFTKQLAQELMSSIKPELDEYKREEVKLSHDQAQHEAALKRMKLEEAARLEILRVESAKRQAAAALQDEGSKDRKSLLQEKVFIEVDVMEVVETVEDALQDAVDMSANTIADSLQDTIDDMKVVAEVAEAELEAVVKATEGVIERAEKHFIEETVASVAERERQLKIEHDVAEAEIHRLTGEEVKWLQQERKAAEELARATLLAEEALIREAEEALIREAEEARRALDKQLEAGKMELEQELVDAASVAVNAEVVEVEKIVVEDEVIKEVIETELIEEVEQLVHDVEQVESEAVQDVERVESELAELEEVVESTLDRLALEEVDRLKREQAAAEAELSAVAFETEQQIASSAGVRLPQQHGHLDSNANAVGGPASSSLTATAPALRSIVEETERRHMVMLSVAFVVLALATAFVLFPRWRRLVASPTRETKAMSSWGRRSRRRSWQRAAQASDSEPEEVVLLQTGSSSEDELSATNEPEPEVVELMSGTDSATTTPRSTFTRTSRTTISSYSRTLDFTGGDVREDSEDGEEEEPTRPPPRALRRRHR